MTNTKNQNNQYKQQIINIHGHKQHDFTQITSNPKNINQNIKQLQHITTPEQQKKTQQNTAYRCVNQ